MPSVSRQRIRYVHSADGTQIAWADAGSGPLLIKASNWLTHLEYEWESPVWRHWIRFFAEHFRFVRYDERGCGMSDWNMGALSFERSVEDLESVVTAARPHRALRAPRDLAGGGGIDRLRGTAPRTRLPPHPLRRLRARLGTPWRPPRRKGVRRHRRAGPRELGQGQPGLSRGVHVPVRAGSDGRAEGLVQRAVPEDDVARERRRPARDALADRRRLAPRPGPGADAGGACEPATASRPSRRDASWPPGSPERSSSSWTHGTISCSRANRPGDDSVRPCSTSWGSPLPEARGDQAFDALSPRERAILALLTEGLANAEIAERLAISEKTVRNHVSNVFDKLGSGRAPRRSSSRGTVASGPETVSGPLEPDRHRPLLTKGLDPSSGPAG